MMSKTRKSKTSSYKQVIWKYGDETAEEAPNAGYVVACGELMRDSGKETAGFYVLENHFICF